MEVGRLASGSWPETFIFPAVSGEEGVGGWQPAVWRVVPAKCGRFPAGGEGQVLATTLCTNHTLGSRDTRQVRRRELTRGSRLCGAITGGDD